MVQATSGCALWAQMWGKLTAKYTSFPNSNSDGPAGVRRARLPAVPDRDGRGAPGSLPHGPDPGGGSAAHQAGRVWALLQDGGWRWR